MPSIEESKRQVKAGLDSVKGEIDHDAVLASLQHEIDKHNEAQRGLREDLRKHENAGGDENDEQRSSSLKFRFKSNTSDPRKRKHSSRHHSRHRHHRSHRGDQRDDEHGREATHPFPREFTERHGREPLDSHEAFRESLFDALADDEGAAYWESVYSQPIHVYPRPAVETAKGELEQMNDEDYAAYVQTKMWEKKNPHIVREREHRERRRRQEEEERTRQREAFTRRKQRAAWERAERAGARKFAGSDDADEENADHEYVFDFETKVNFGAEPSTRDQQRNEYHQAWKCYLSAWDSLKQELLKEHLSPSQNRPSRDDISKQIPWPVLPSKPVIKRNIENFMQWITESQDGRSRLQLLKVERVRWHPDKIQQLFGGHVDEGTMKLVTGVFQIVDALVEYERDHKGEKA